ncbi:protein kinase domain-containing protein, partial [Haematococcus lacustris]
MPGYSGPLSKLPQPEVEEDEATKRVVAAAEAAAATSADQESQSAVSEGLLQRPALVAEFLSGCSLGSAIARQADFLSSNLVLTKVALDAARGMEYCHGKRVTHWNLKTGNLIVGFSSDKVPLCKIADVGLSRPRQLHALDEVGVARVLPWAAPELCRTPESVNEKVDVYSFGVVLWSMWSRRNPSDGQEIARMFLRIMQGHVVRPPIP